MRRFLRRIGQGYGNLRLTHEVLAAVRAIGEGKGKQDLFKERAPDVLENLHQVAIIESTESSNRLEGVTLPRTAIEVLVRRNEDPHEGNRFGSRGCRLP